MEVDDTTTSAAAVAVQDGRASFLEEYESSSVEENGESPAANTLSKGSRRSLLKKKAITRGLITADEDMEFEHEGDAEKSKRNDRADRSVSATLSTPLKLEVSTTEDDGDNDDGDLHDTNFDLLNSSRPATSVAAMKSRHHKKRRSGFKPAAPNVSEAPQKNGRHDTAAARKPSSSLSPPMVKRNLAKTAVVTDQHRKKSLLTVKRKHYDMRKYESEECLLGFDEENGQAVFGDLEDMLEFVSGGISGSSSGVTTAVVPNEDLATMVTMLSSSRPVKKFKKDTEEVNDIPEPPVKEQQQCDERSTTPPPKSNYETFSNDEPANNISLIPGTPPTPPTPPPPPPPPPPSAHVLEEEPPSVVENDAVVNTDDEEEQPPPTASPTTTPSPGKKDTIVAEDLENNAITPAESNIAAPQQTTAATAPQKPKSAQDEYYKKPFEYGWKRELVYRANMEMSKDKADVYFITPTGRKLRTKTDILPLLEGELTLDHFCFAKEPVGGSADFEIVRSAKPTVRTSAAATAAVSPFSDFHRTPISGKRISKPKVPKGASPPPQGWTPTRALKNSSSLLNSTSNKTTGGISSTGSVTSTPTTPPSSRATLKASKTKKNFTLDAHHIENEVQKSPHGGAGTTDRPSKRNNNNNSGENTRRNSRKHSAASNDLHVTPSRTVTSATSPQSYFISNSVGCELSTKSFATNFFANVSFGYDAILCVLKYLKIHERPRAASVCKIWNLVAKDMSLWRTVRMKNSKVNNWSGFAAALRRGETKHLDLRKMLLSSTKAEEMWTEFSKYIGTVCSLEGVDLCRCSARVVESLFNTNENLRILNAVAINDETINLQNISKLQALTELRLRSTDLCTLEGDLMPLKSIKGITHLSLTSIRNLGTKSIEIIGELTTLQSLELGECGDFDAQFSDGVLPKLANLQRLRMENGSGTCCTLEVLDSAAKLEKLTQLEFVNFDIKPGFDEKLVNCTNIRKLLVIPTYISQSATTNNIVLQAVLKLKDTLEVFTWGVTVELLRVTALYVDQCEDSTKKERRHFDECIPVLKPVPGAVATDSPEPAAGPNAVPQIEILPLDKVETILGDNLFTTKFKIVKVPFQATLKQHLVE